MGFLHWDIKIDNVLFDLSKSQVLLCDFGISAFSTACNIFKLFKIFIISLRNTLSICYSEFIR